MKFISRVLIAGVVFSLLCPQLARADQKAVADAKKAVTDAQVAVNKAQGDYDKAKAAVKAELAKTPEYVAASKDLAKAKLDLDAASKPVADKVHASADFVAAQKSFADNDAKVKSLTMDLRSGNASSSITDQLAAANSARAAAKTKMEQLENEAMASDPAVQAAKTRIADAQKKIDEMDTTKLPPMIEADKPCTDAKKALDDAQVKLTEAKAALDDAIKQNREESKSGSGHGNKGGGMRH